MTLPLIAQKTFITQYLAAYLEEQDPSALQANSIVGDSLTELTRLQMREIAADDSDRWYWGNSILDQALQQILSDIESHLPSLSSAHLDQHLERVRENLKSVAKEMTDLQAKLQRARKREQVLSREKCSDNVEVPFEIIAMGTPKSLEGFIVIPNMAQECYLHLENLDPSWGFTGEWFPFQLVIDELTFVVDDDGTIFISTDNFPETLISHVWEMLYQIARQLYTNRSIS